jgi:hypothetical protein
MNKVYKVGEEIKAVSTVRFVPEYCTFVSDSQDVQPIKEHIGELAQDYDAFFVHVNNGDYTEIWGIVGIIPSLSKLATRLL